MSQDPTNSSLLKRDSAFLWILSFLIESISFIDSISLVRDNWDNDHVTIYASQNIDDTH